MTFQSLPAALKDTQLSHTGKRQRSWRRLISHMRGRTKEGRKNTYAFHIMD